MSAYKVKFHNFRGEAKDLTVLDPMLSLSSILEALKELKAFNGRLHQMDALPPDCEEALDQTIEVLDQAVNYDPTP